MRGLSATGETLFASRNAVVLMLINFVVTVRYHESR
jgi:hypothetical protein